MRTEGRGLADQAIASGVNFLTLVLVARALGPREFGYFALVFTLLQSLGALQLALVTRPHNVLGARREGADYVCFTSSVAAYQVALSLAAAALLALGGGIARAAGVEWAQLFLVAAPALVAWQLQELGRRILYTERRLGGALANDALSYGCQAALLVALWQSGRLTGTSALVVVGATSAVSAAVAALQLRRSLGRRLDRRAIAETWRFGRWLGAAEASYWLESQYYVYLAAAFAGAAASAALKAAQTLLGPVSVFLAFFVNYLPIRFARLGRPGEPDALRRHLRLGLPATVPATAAYALLVAVFARPLLELVYGTAYGRYSDVVRLFALYYVLLSVSDVVVASLAARGLTRRVFVGHAAGALVSVAAGWALLDAFGASGGVAGMILAIGTAFVVFVSLPGLRQPPARSAA